MAHNVLINLLAHGVDLAFEVLGGNAQTAVKVDLVGLQGWENQVGAD